MRRFVLFAVLRIFDSYDFAGSSVLSQKPKRIQHDFPLQLSHVGPAQAISYLEPFGIERARWTHLGRDLRTDRDQDRRNASHFNFSLDRHDRAVTDVRSTTRENYGVGPRAFVDIVGDLSRGAFVHRF